MIYLYDSTETDFRYNGKPLHTAYDVTVSNTLNSEYYVMGKYPLDKDKAYKKIVEDRIIKVHTMDGMQPFRIVNVSKHELYVEFEAWPLFYADMRNKLVKPLSLKGVSGQTALNSFKNNLLIDTPFDFYSDITDNHDYHTQDKNERENNPKQLYNALDVFKTIVNRWGGELWIRGYDIRVNKRIGTDTEAMLYEKKNITEFVDTTNIEGIVTRLHGKSEWQYEPQEGEEEGQKHSIETTVNSPLINNYSGVVFEKQYTNNNIRTEKALKDWLNLKFTTDNIDKPQRSIEVGTNIVDGMTINFADTLILKYIKHDTDVRIKVVGYEYDGFANELKHVVLGQPKHTSSSTIGNTITDLVNNVVDPLDRKATIAMSSADGKSTVFHGTADPNTLGLNANLNDTYFRTNGSEKEIWRFTGTLWELIMDTSDTTKNADAIKEHQKEIDVASEKADEALGEIDAAIRDKGFTSLMDLTTNLDVRLFTQNESLEGVQTIISDPETGISSLNTQLANLVQIAVTGDELTGAISVLNDNINLRVQKDDIINQINISDESILIQSDRILLDGDVTVSGTAWMDGAVIANASIDGAKIVNATISSAKIANLDVSKISGNTAEFVRLAFNSVNSSLTLTSLGISSTQTVSGTTNEVRLGGRGLEFYSQGTLIGLIHSAYNTDYGHRQIIFSPFYNDDLVISSGGTPSDPYFTTPTLRVKGDGSGIDMYSKVSMNSETTFLQDGNFQKNIYVASTGMIFFNNANHYIRHSSSQLWVHSSQDVSIATRNVTRIRVSTQVSVHATLNMNNNTIINQSDERLKTHIIDDEIDSLTEISKWRMAGFNWVDNPNGERQFGVIAQSAQEILIGGGDGYLSINSTKQLNMVTHAVQQLAKKELDTNILASQALQATETNAQKIKRLEERIKELESVI